MKIMLVDDQEISNFIMKKVIEVSIPDATVVDFTNPAAALESIKAECPDIILLDLNMPDMNGWQFLQQMDELSISNKVAIVTSSTSMEDMDASKSFQNVVDFLIKPINKEDLVAALKNL